MNMFIVYPVQDMVEFIRKNAVDSERRMAVVRDGVRHAKELQRTNSQKYENAISSLLLCLEFFEIDFGGALETIGTLTVLDILLRLDLTTVQIAQCNSYVVICLCAANDELVALAASRTFSETLANTMATEFAQARIDDAILWIELEDVNMRARRLCGLLLLHEVTLRTPMLILPKLNVLFEKLWLGLASQDKVICEASLQLFKMCGKVLSNTPPTLRVKTVDLLLYQLKSHLAAKSNENNIAGLLAFEAIVMSSTGSSTQPRYEDLSIMLVPYVMTGRSFSSSEHMRKQLFHCLVVLCRYSVTLFITNQLKDTVSFALKSIKNFFQHSAAFDMLSEIIPIVGKSAFAPFVKETCNSIVHVFVNSPTPCWESLKCFSVICRECPPADVESYIELCLENVFNWGLSSQLIESMRDIISSSSTQYRAKLEEALLDMISVTLCGLPFRQNSAARTQTTPHHISGPTESQIEVALNALVQFGFSDFELMGDFLRDSALPLIDSASSSVRNAAIRAIVRLLIPLGIEGDLTMARRICVDIIVSRMLVVGLTNPDPVIRQTLLLSFTPPFYPYLSEVQFFTKFYAALGDEDVRCRIAIIELLCRMINHDPSHILPIFRKEVLVIIRTLAGDSSINAVHEELLMLDAIASNAPQFVVNFSDGIVKALVRYFSSLDAHSPILQSFLACCTSVARAERFFGRNEFIFVDEVKRVCEFLDLLPLGTEFVTSRLLCLRFLGATLGPQIRGRSPYDVYPHLYRMLSGILKNNDDELDVRLEALRCAGSIGALDTSVFQSLTMGTNEKQSKLEQCTFNVLSHAMCCRYVLQAIAALLDPSEKLFLGSKDSLLRVGIHTILNIGESCPSSRSEMVVVIPPLVRAASELSVGRLLGAVIYELTHIVRYVGVAALVHINILYTFLDDVWARCQACRFLTVRLAWTVAKYETEGHQKLWRSEACLLPIKFDALNDVDSSECLRYAILEYIVRRIETLQVFIEIVVPNLLEAMRNESMEFAVHVVTALQLVCWKLSIGELAGVIVRGLLNSLRYQLSNSIKTAEHTLFTNGIMGVFCVLMVQLQGEFIKYSTDVLKTLKEYQISSSEFFSLQRLLMKGCHCILSKAFLTEQEEQVLFLLKKSEAEATKEILQLGDVWNARTNTEENLSIFSDDERPIPFSEQRIINTIKTVPLTKEEWVRWMDHFFFSIMQESPYRVFRCVSVLFEISTTSLADRSPNFTQDIMCIAFRVLWNFASVSVRSFIIDLFQQTLQQPMQTSTVPDDVITVLLSIIEYMDIVGMTLPISPSSLSDCAWQRGMLAKALYWREAAYRADPEGTVESLITLYGELCQPDSAVCILTNANENQRRYLLQQSGLLKLAGYTEALQITQKEIDGELALSDTSSEKLAKRLPYRSKNYLRFCRSKNNMQPDASSSLFGKDLTLDLQMEREVRQMLSLSEFGDYDKVLEQWEKIFKKENDKKVKMEENVLFYVSQYAADASIRLRSWNTLEETLHWMPRDNVKYHIFYAALNINKGNYDIADMSVKEGRKELLQNLSGLLHESYTRAYSGLVIAQELCELEEVIAAKRLEESFLKQHLRRVLRLWDQRIEIMSPTVPVWREVLGVRGLLISPSKDVTTGLRFVKLCRRENAKQLERFTLDQLLGYRSPTYEELMSCNANPRVVMQYISFLAANGELGPKSQYGLEKDLLKKMIDTHSKPENTVFLSRIYARLGTKAEPIEARECYRAATLHDPNWFHAWRMYAEMNVELLKENFSDAACAAAIEGYIQSIKLGHSNSTMIQDVLKLLTLLSNYCDHENGLREFGKRMLDVSSRAWSLVVPQIIARLDSGSDGSCQLVASILTAVAFDYPLFLIFPLNVCAMSDSERRRKWANIILDKMQSKFPIIVLQGRIVIDELIRISDLVYEQWYEQLENAATAFFGRKNCEEMVDRLLLMHEKLNSAHETILEVEFNCKHKRSLDEAKEWLLSYKRTKEIADLHSAWHIYHAVYRQIDMQIKYMNRLSLAFCSPKLFEARNLVIGVPDAVPTDHCTVSCIASFSEKLVVVSSKQRPKRFSVTTFEGKKQEYLLKGREDLRLDERVMQLFCLVNTLMMSDSRTCRNSGFQIQRYSVTPLKDTVGLIGWVSGCDTLLELVKKYREFRGIPWDLELLMLNQIIVFDHPKAYDFHTIMSKVEIVEFLADHTSGHDIRKAMWASAAGCERWLEQRQMFTTSLATTSVVGYILGLGDRHPNNIMIQRTSGVIVHIDFGDCFEVAMTRDKFPEKVPFRLTRMLQNALDVSGVNGSFRTTAETAMWVLRDGSQSVLSILEAFIQDPLISWRLLNWQGKEPKASRNHKDFEKMRAGGLHMQSSYPGGPPRRPRSAEAVQNVGLLSQREEVDMIHKGVAVFERVRSKLKGNDFVQAEISARNLTPKVQVARLIVEATDITNVAQSWSGWYPFW